MLHRPILPVQMGFPRHSPGTSW
ncbi:unnamed protein product [Timema podura]|uniref:Uncharacterized protein n=1 Tax=Timema podura TaxID=61482 RepID=A0ABN7PNH6_TIMPD|nr:unnamed protein product [Timema podura]